MDCFLVVTDKQTANSEETISIDENQFAQFMKRKPIWEFASLAKSIYLSLRTDEKPTLINRCYKFMKFLEENGKFDYILFFFLDCCKEKMSKRTASPDFAFSRQEI